MGFNEWAISTLGRGASRLDHAFEACWARQGVKCPSAEVENTIYSNKEERMFLLPYC